MMIRARKDGREFSRYIEAHREHYLGKNYMGDLPKNMKEETN